MGYFERNNKEFFNLFNGERAELYYDIIDEFIKMTRKGRNEIDLEEAKSMASFHMKRHPKVGGATITAKDILNDIEKHKWLYMRKSGNARFYRLTPNALTQYKAMMQMDEERDGNDFEFENAIIRVYHTCQDYQDNKSEYNGETSTFYVRFLKSIYEDVDTLIIELHKCEADFEEQSEKLNRKIEDVVELMDLMVSILDGKAMKNYYRLLNDDNKFTKYQELIQETLLDVKDYEIENLINSYRIETGANEDDATEYIENVLNSIIEFFNYIYHDLKSNIASIQKKCNKKINNRFEAISGGSLETFDASKQFIHKIVKELENNGNQRDPISDELKECLNIYTFSTFEGEKSLRHRVVKVVTTRDNTPIVMVKEEIDKQTLLDKQNDVIQHDLPHTAKYIKEKYGDKLEIAASDLCMESKEDCRRTFDIIQYSMNENNNFPYKLIPADGEPIKTKYMEILSPFVLKKRGRLE